MYYVSRMAVARHQERCDIEAWVFIWFHNFSSSSSSSWVSYGIHRRVCWFNMVMRRAYLEDFYNRLDIRRFCEVRVTYHRSPSARKRPSGPDTASPTIWLLNPSPPPPQAKPKPWRRRRILFKIRVATEKEETSHRVTTGY